MSSNLALEGIKDILNRLNDDDLNGLILTVTQRLLKYEQKSKQEAIEVILKYSPDILSILKRRTVTKDILFTYLHEKNITVELPTTKDKLIAEICTLWNLSVNKSNTVTDIESKIDAEQSQHQQQEPTPVVTSNIGVMAEKFSQWFYDIMNKNECIDSNHFFPDASLKLNLISNSVEETEEISSSQCIVEMLFNTKVKHNLYFNPNLNSEGVQGRLNPHGLVMILTCGTLHSNNICVGIFEQVFALARDPFCANNWKIKQTQLNLRSKSDNIHPPSLSDNPLTSELLLLPSN